MQASQGNGAPFAQPARPTEGQITTKAVMRAASKLGISNRALGSIIGVSDAQVSRYATGTASLEMGTKPFELALLLIRIYRSLDTIMGGDDAASASWLKNWNEALSGTPLELIQSVPGLTNVLAYLDARRAIV